MSPQSFPPSHPNASHLFQLNLNYRLRADVVWRFWKWPPFRPSWISEQDDLNNSKCSCCPYTFHQSFGSIRISVREQITIEDIQDGRNDGCGNLEYCNKMILAILNFHVATIPTIKFWLNPTYHSGHLRCRNRTILGILTLFVAPMPPVVLTQSNLQFGWRCCFKNWKMRF